MSFVTAGTTAFAAEPRKTWVFVALFLGVFIHWVYEVAVAAIRSNGIWDFGNLGVIIARLVISLVASAAAFISAYNQVAKLDPDFRLVSAFVLGLGVDALTTPWTTTEPVAPTG